MGKKSGPPAPDYTAAAEKTAESQQEQVLQQTWANRANQVNPWGTSTWDSQKSIDPATGKPVTQWTQTTSLDPRLQHALDSQIAMQSGRSDLANSLFPRAQAEFGRPMSWQGITGWADVPQNQQTQAITSPMGFGPRGQAIDVSRQMGPEVDTSRQQAPNVNQSLQATPQLNTNLGAGAGQGMQRSLDFGGVQGVDDAAATRQRAEDAIYQSATSRLDPQWDQRQQQLENQLANRGISVNSEAYSRAMEDFQRSRTDAYNQAQMASITGGGAEAQRDFGMDLGLRQQQVGELGQQGQFANTAQQQAFQQRLMGGQAGNEALQAQFGMGSQALQQQLAAQQAAFGMGSQAREQQLGAQQAAFGFGNTARQQQLAAQQAAYQQSLSGAQFGLGQQQQAFAQQAAANQQNFGQGMQQAAFQNQMRQNQIAEAMQRRGFSLNEINAIMSGQQVGMPSFQGYNTASLGQGVDYSGAASNQFQAGMQKQQMANDAMSSVMQGVGTAAMMFSDARVKRDIRRIGRHPRGFGIYRYRYIGERGKRVGVIAQEVKRYAPELVDSVRGVLRVNYSAL